MSILDKKIVVINLETVGGSIYDKFTDDLNCDRDSIVVLTGNAPVWKYLKVLDAIGSNFDAAGIFDPETLSILITHSRITDLAKYDLIKYDADIPQKPSTVT